MTIHRSRKALITVVDEDKPEAVKLARGLDDFSHKLDALSYDIVSLGGTGREIAKAGISYILSSVLTGKELPPDLSERDEREQREIIGAQLGQYMWQSRDKLQAAGRPVIDVAFISLMPPEPKFDDDGRYAGVKHDKGGFFMLSSLIEGGGDTIVDPEQVEPLLEALPNTNPDEIAKRRYESNGVAGRYLIAYAAKVEETRRAARETLGY